ncbi:hypothetical protein XAP6164_1550001 [Xanthomonas phaseoli pv. phaseoli]|nr:hypothetical protein XAP6164_1550001 [Xanthomonas phaseoli pv. phaseoli]
MGGGIPPAAGPTVGGWRWSATVKRALRLSSPRKEISAAKVSELHESLNVTGQLQRAGQRPASGKHLREAIRQAGSLGSVCVPCLAGRKPV